LGFCGHYVPKSAAGVEIITSSVVHSVISAVSRDFWCYFGNKGDCLWGERARIVRRARSTFIAWTLPATSRQSVHPRHHRPINALDRQSSIQPPHPPPPIPIAPACVPPRGFLLGAD